MTAPSESRTSALKRKYADLGAQFIRSKQANHTLLQLFDAIKSRSESDASAIVQRIRAGVDPDSILRHVRTGDLLLQLQVAPESRYRFDFPYQAHMPSLLRVANNPYLQSILFEASSMLPDPTSPTPSVERYTPQYTRPYVAATIVDARLKLIAPSRWTQVSNDDDLMRQLLHQYFLHEYQWFPMFHKDDFLDDMLTGSEQFCTPLLVNVVLALSCHSHRSLTDRADFWNPHSLGYRFTGEAKRLWELERSAQASLPTVQAGALINILYNSDSLDKIGRTFTVQSVAMAYGLKLFGPTLASRTRKGRNSYDVTAWCLFSWAVKQDYHLAVPLLINEPPKSVLPDPDTHRTWYPEFSLKYPMADTVCAQTYGHYFKAKCDLICVIHCIAARRSSVKDILTVPGGSQAASQYVLELIAWHSSLRPAILPANIVFPGQLKLHLLFHELMITMCEIVIADTSLATTAEPPLNDPHAILAHSRVCFETLIRLYYLRHGFEGADIYFTHQLALLAWRSQTSLQALSAAGPSSDLEDVRSTLILAVKGLHAQGKNYYFSQTVFWAVFRGMSAADAELMYKYAEIRKEDATIGRLRAKHVQTQYPCVVMDKSGHPEKQRLGDMMQQYAHLQLQTPAEEDAI